MFRDLVLFRQVFSFFFVCSTPANGSNIICSEFAIAVLIVNLITVKVRRGARRLVFNRVFPIFPRGARVEVVRITATPIAAVVVDLKISWVSVEQRVGLSMCCAISFHPWNVTTPVAITGTTDAAFPFPALVR